MNVKSWHIWDFPDNIYVLIKKEVREEFFNEMYKKFGSQKNYAKFLNKDRISIQKYHYARSWDHRKKHVSFMPLKILHKSLHFMNEKLKSKIENNILELRCRVGNPMKLNLPIKESPELYRIVAHILGDGSATKRKVPYYSNTCKELREKFKEDLKILGNIKSYERDYTNVPIVCFQKPLAEILSHILKISFIDKENIPKRLFETLNDSKIAFLQALFDDEGTISTNLAICMKSKNILKEIKDLLLSLDIESGKISLKPKSTGSFGEITYTLSIKAKFIKDFKEKIGFLHPEKSRKLNVRLKIIERNLVQRTRPLEWSRDKILKLLTIKPMLALELCEELLLTLSHMHRHLKYLENKDFIERTGYKNRLIWKIKDQGLVQIHS